MNTPTYSLSDLLRVMARLRDPDTGCPWDLRQDFRSIVSSTLEECYELVAAIEDDDSAHIADELGDVLFQVIFYARLGEERELFSFETVVSGLVEKLLRRHPHVFANGEIEGVLERKAQIEDVKESWESIKAIERQARSQVGVLADVPLALPAMSRAQKLQTRAAKHNFDWHNTEGVFEKLQEEIEELKDAVQSNDTQGIAEEMGDVLFTSVNLARHLHLDAESSLRNSSRKFERRIAMMEALCEEEGVVFSTLEDKELDALWERAKALL